MTETAARLATSLGTSYRIERELGRGGMATVYLARDLKHQRLVALKVLDPELGAVLGADRFLSEIRVTANLQHPNLLPLFDSGEANGLLYYVMPFVEGETLRARLDREKQLPVEQSVRIAVAVANALTYAHERGVIHRDLKPENILFQAGQPVVADFGIALAVSNAGGQRVTQTGLSLGTPQYMSPEQATGDRAIDARTDIYSLGAVAYEMLTGDPPHTGSSAQAIISRVMTEKPRPIRASRDTVPPHVERAIDIALSKLPADRFANARDFALALEGKGDPSVLRVAPSEARGPRIRARELAAWTLLAAATASLVWTLARSRSDIEAPVIRTEFAVPAGLRLPAPNAATIALSPQGDRLAFFVQDSSGTRILVRRSSELRGHEITHGSLLYENLTFSPDGRWIAYTDGFDIKKAPSDGGPSVSMGSAPNLRVRGLSWTATDTILIGSPTGIWTVPAGGGAVKRAIVFDSTQRHYWPVASPDGKLVAFITGITPDQSRLTVASLKDRTSFVLDVPAVAPVGFLDGHLLYVTALGTLNAVPFNAQRMRATGDPVQIEDSVRVSDSYLGAVATMSTSGTLAYVSGVSTNDLVTASPGHADALVVPDAGYYKNPRWSPDGKRIALAIGNSATTNIWIFDTALRTMRQLTSEGSNGIPEWTADGERVVFRSLRAGKVGVWWQRADGAGKAELLYEPEDQLSEAILSPDGKWLIYRTGPAARHPSDIFAVPLTGDRKPVAIVTGPSADVMPRLSPDGKWLAYQTDQSSRAEIYVLPFPGLGGPVQVSNQGGREPMWGKSGRTLYYRTQAGSVVAVAVGTGSTFSIGERRTVVSGDYAIDQTHASFDVSPDETRFLMLRRAAGESRPMIVYNWAREVKEKLAGGRK